MASVSLFTHFTLLFSHEEINFAFYVLSPASHHRLTTVIWSCSSSVLAGDCEILLRDRRLNVRSQYLFGQFWQTFCTFLIENRYIAYSNHSKKQHFYRKSNLFSDEDEFVLISSGVVISGRCLLISVYLIEFS